MLPNRVLSVKIISLAKLMNLEVEFPEKIGLIVMVIQRLSTYQNEKVIGSDH